MLGHRIAHTSNMKTNYRSWSHPARLQPTMLLYRRDEKRRLSLIFSSRAYALVSRGKRLRHSHAEVLRAVTLQRKIRDCSQSIICWHVVRCYTSFIIFSMFLGHHPLPISTKEVLITWYFKSYQTPLLQLSLSVHVTNAFSIPCLL